MTPGRTFNATFSIVSHRQGALVALLLGDIARHCPADVEVVVVVNVPEDEGYLHGFPPDRLTVIRNETARGFGANHNAASRVARGRHFVVTNPDVRFHSDPLPPITSLLQRSSVGAVGPLVLGPSGTPEDSARRFPTVLSLARRVLTKRGALDYDGSGPPLSIDWAAGMFLAFRNETFKAVGGFDERFFLYFEDVDLCARLHMRGLEVYLQPASIVIHDARRHSHRDLKYLSWHLASAMRYLARRAAGRYRGAA